MRSQEGGLNGPPLMRRRLVFVLGKGGVGKSAVAAALGTAWARRGTRALVIEVGGQHRLSPLFGTRTDRDDEPVELAPGLFGVSVDVERSTEDYLAAQLKVRPLVDLLTRSKAFHNFTTAAPGLAEMVTLGRIWNLAIDVRDGRPVWDHLVVDCPATGHGIALIGIAGRVGEMAGEGPIHHQAERIQQVVTHPAATGVAVVARPEELPVSEAAEAVEILRRDGYPVAAVVLNGVHPAPFSPAEAAPLEEVATSAGAAAAPAASALRSIRRAAVERTHRRRLTELTGMEPLILPALAGRSLDRAGVERLADALLEADAAARVEA